MVSPNGVRSPAERSTKIPRSICDSTSRAQVSASLRVRKVSVTGGQPVRRTCACHCSGPFCRMVAIAFLLTHATQLCQNCANGFRKTAMIADVQSTALILKENLARPRRFERPTFAFGAQRFLRPRPLGPRNYIVSAINGRSYYAHQFSHFH